jgi:hypothetical protein
LKKDWKKDRAAAAKHARLIRRKPELRALLYGVERPPAQDAHLSVDVSNTHIEPRETAQREGQKDG